MEAGSRQPINSLQAVSCDQALNSTTQNENSVPKDLSCFNTLWHTAKQRERSNDKEPLGQPTIPPASPRKRNQTRNNPLAQNPIFYGDLLQRYSNTSGTSSDAESGVKQVVLGENRFQRNYNPSVFQESLTEKVVSHAYKRRARSPPPFSISSKKSNARPKYYQKKTSPVANRNPRPINFQSRENDRNGNLNSSTRNTSNNSISSSPIPEWDPEYRYPFYPRSVDPLGLMSDKHS